jgi:hypothetical protein
MEHKLKVGNKMPTEYLSVSVKFFLISLKYLWKWYNLHDLLLRWLNIN